MALIESVKAIIGLFIPVKFKGAEHWTISMSVGGVPLGWLIIVIALLVKVL